MAGARATELVALFEKATQAADRAWRDGALLAPEEARCTDALTAMGAVTVSTSLLMSTQVGKRLRKLTKHKSSVISSSAQELLDAWKKVVAAEAAAKSGTSKDVSPSAMKPDTPARAPPSAVVKSETKTDIKVYTSKRVDVQTLSPSPKVAPSPKAESKPLASPSAATSSSGDGFEPKLGPLPRAGGDATRDRFRELLLEALKKCCREVMGKDLEKAKTTDFVSVVVAVECALFSKLGLSKGSEKAKYRSIIFNLKDDKNPDFRRRVLLGEIKPEEIVSMTADDMASDARKKENEGIREKALFECERGMQNVASTDQFRCGKCGQRKTTYFQLQTRSADEPMTTFVQCVNCNARWKFC